MRLFSISQAVKAYFDTEQDANKFCDLLADAEDSVDGVSLLGPTKVPEGPNSGQWLVYICPLA